MHRSMTISTYSPLLLLCFLSACAWSQPPKAKNSLLAPIEVRPALSQKAQGQLMLLPQGQWVYVQSKTPGATKDFHVGQILGAYQEEQKTPSHLFAVIFKRDWGYVLNRLDHTPLAQNLDNFELTPFDVNEAKEDNVCVGKQTYTKQTCLSNAPLGTQWSVYALDAKTGRIANLPKKATSDPFHIKRAAYVHRGSSGITAIDIATKQAPKQWIAIAHPALASRHPNIRIAHDCKSEPKAVLPAVTFVKKQWKPQTHPLKVETQTYKFAVDALYSCKRQSLSVPSLWRPDVRAYNGVTHGPALIGAHQHSLKKLSPSQRADLVQASAWIATGQWGLADALIERSIGRIATDEKHLATLLKYTMQITGLVRAEAALNMGWRATQSSWNREEDIAYQLGLVSVYSSMGLQRQGLVAESKTAEIRNRQKESPLRGWLAWRTATMLLDEGRLTYSKDISSLESKFGTKDAELWMSALYVQMFAKNLLPKTLTASLERRLKGQGARPLWQALRLEKVDLECPKDQTCTLDTYGRYLLNKYHANTNRTELMQHIANIKTQPGFMRNVNDDNLHPLHIAKMIQLQQFEQPLESLRILAYRLGKHDNICAHKSQLAEMAIDYERQRTKENRKTLYQWLLQDALSQWCEEQSKDKALSQMIPKQNPAFKTKADLLVSLISGALDNQKTKANRQNLLKLGAAWSGDYRVGSKCYTWNMTLALANYLSDQPDKVSPFLLRASNCSGKLSKTQRDNIAILSAFTQYERHGSYGYNLAPAVVRATAIKTGKGICQGLEDRMPSVLGHIEPQIITQARRMIAQTPKPKSKDELQLMTSRQTIAQAKKDLQRAGQLISEANVSGGLKLLKQARAAFQRARYIPGQRSINWIEQELFGGNLKDISASRAWVSTRLKDGQAQLLYTELSQNKAPNLVQKRVLIALALLLEGVAPTTTWIGKLGGAKIFKTLCKP